jgi:hypothetical protein
MSTWAIEIEIPFAVNAQATEDTISVDLSDGRTISVPLGWFFCPIIKNPWEKQENPSFPTSPVDPLKTKKFPPFFPGKRIGFLKSGNRLTLVQAYFH